MNKYKITIEYNGTNFVGWQKQTNGISIQFCIEDALFKLTGEKVTIFGAGRTDAGVHARGQVAHFEITKLVSLDSIRDGLNQHLKKNPISILKSEKVGNDFNARFSAKIRSYQYKIINRRSPLTIEKNLALGVFKKLNINEMKKAAKLFIGKYDFNAFRSINCQSSSSIKTVNSCVVSQINEEITINVSARSFLHSQVRIMVGTLIEIGKGKIGHNELAEIIASKDRARAGPTVPAHGLYLINVEY